MTKADSFTQDYTEADFTLRAGELSTLVINHGLGKSWPLITIYDENGNNILSNLNRFIYHVDTNTIEMRFQDMPTIGVWHIRMIA